MGFTCQHCGTVQPSGTVPHKTVTKQRTKVYPRRYAEDGETILDNGGKGVETVEELDLCEKCAEKQAKKPVQLI